MPAVRVMPVRSANVIWKGLVVISLKTASQHQDLRQFWNLNHILIACFHDSRLIANLIEYIFVPICQTQSEKFQRL